MVFIYWVVRELFLANSYRIIFGLLILLQCTIDIQHSLIYFLETQISFIEHIFQNYYKKVFLGLNFHGNKKTKLKQRMQ